MLEIELLLESGCFFAMIEKQNIIDVQNQDYFLQIRRMAWNINLGEVYIYELTQTLKDANKYNDSPPT